MIFELKIGLIWYITLIFSIVAHEFTHAYCAFKLGEKSIQKEGLLTINPIPHLKREVIGTIVFPIIFFIKAGFMIGWAAIPVDLNWAKKFPNKFIITTLSAPIANLLILIIVSIILHIGLNFDIVQRTEKVTYALFIGSAEYLTLSIILCIIFSMNLILFFFSILPLPSFDGFSIILFLLRKEDKGELIIKFQDKKFKWTSGIILGIIFLLFFENIHTFLVNFIF
jgi:Zn-dependent protease